MKALLALAALVYLAIPTAGVACFGWFFKSRDYRHLQAEQESLVAAVSRLEARNEFLEAQHVTDQTYIDRYVHELDAVTEATRPVPTDFLGTLAAILDLPEAGDR